MDKDRDELRRELKSGRFDPMTTHQPQGIGKQPTELEKMQFGEPTRLVPGDEDILPDYGKPVGDSRARRVGNQGVLDPAEDGHPLPEGLERKRAGPLNKNSGRRKPRQA